MAVCVRSSSGQYCCTCFLTVQCELCSAKGLIALLGLCCLIRKGYGIGLHIVSISLFVRDLVELVGLGTIMFFAIVKLFRIRQRIDTESVVISGICDSPCIAAICGVVGILDFSGILVLIEVLGFRRVTQCCVISDDDLAVAVRLDIVFFQCYRKFLRAISACDRIICVIGQRCSSTVFDGQVLDCIERGIQFITDLKDAGIINRCVRGCRLPAFFRCLRCLGGRIGRDCGLDLKGDGVAVSIAVTALGVDSIALGSRSVSKNDHLVNSGSCALCISHIAIGKLGLGIN